MIIQHSLIFCQLCFLHACHVRHGDFSDFCEDEVLDDCFAPLSVIARRVEQVREEVLERKGIRVDRVLVTSDEDDPEWWKGVLAQGWEWVDYKALGTVERYNRW